MHKARFAAFLLPVVIAIPIRAQWTALGDMPRPVRQGSSLRFENAQAVAVITAVSADVIRVRVMPGRESSRDHSYAVVNRPASESAATVSVESGASIITTATLRVRIQHAPFRIAFATRDGESLDADDPERGMAISGTAS